MMVSKQPHDGFETLEVRLLIDSLEQLAFTDHVEDFIAGVVGGRIQTSTARFIQVQVQR